MFWIRFCESLHCKVYRLFASKSVFTTICTWEHLIGLALILRTCQTFIKDLVNPPCQPQLPTPMITRPCNPRFRSKPDLYLLFFQKTCESNIIKYQWVSKNKCVYKHKQLPHLKNIQKHSKNGVHQLPQPIPTSSVNSMPKS